MKKYRFTTLLSLTLFILFFAFAMYSNLEGLLHQKQKIIQVEKELSKVRAIEGLIKRLQIERGATGIYTGSFNVRALNLLKRERSKSISFYNTYLNGTQYKNIKNRLAFIHKQVDEKKYTQHKAFNAYTRTIHKLFGSSLKLLLNTKNQQIKNYLIIYEKHNMAQEFLGELRALIAGALEEGKITQKKQKDIISADALFNNYLKGAEFFARAQHVNIYKDLSKSKCYKQTMRIIASVINNNITYNQSDAFRWFNTATCAINSIYMANDKFLQQLQTKLKVLQRTSEIKLQKALLFWMSVIIFAFVLLFYLYKADKKAFIEHNSLHEYKKAIDNSTLVSKTDTKGIITYVNDMFCKISGYTADELIGKNHNILKSFDVPKFVFKDMWKTIKSGHVWHGEIKNLKKNGGYYVVDATITPIFDHEGSIVEYIAIRHDITQIYELNKEVQTTQKELIYRIGEAVESRSQETGNHVRRVAKYSYLLAKLYGFKTKECESISIASTMHDIGKIAIPDSILQKPAKLTANEWKIMKTHTNIGYHILCGSKLPILQLAAQIAYEHHERFDGKGYPNAINGEKISIYAQIVSLVDVFDALISERVYKKAWEYEKVIGLIKEERAKQFNPDLVDLFLSHIDEFMAIKGQYED